MLIEVLVAEVDLGDDLTFGIEFALTQDSRKDALTRVFNGGSASTTGTSNNGSNGSTTTTPSVSVTNLFDVGSAFSSTAANGALALISDNRNFVALLKALASKNKLKVLSSPHLMTADNHEAHILVGQEIPIITTQSNATTIQTNGTSNILQNIQYRDTGVIMTVLPQVNSEGLVNMQIHQEVSKVADTGIGGIGSPTFNTRESETTVVVQSGETIVIGGIIDDTVNRTRSGVPYLQDIPVIGRAFRSDHDNVTRTELVVLLTPHVVRDRQESHSATEAFISRLKAMRRDLIRNDMERPDYGGPRPRPYEPPAPAPAERTDR